MCGRARVYFHQNALERVAEVQFGARGWINRDDFTPSYNAAPGFSVPVVRNAEAGPGPSSAASARTLATMKWGLIPSFQKPDEKPDYFKAFNARSETVSEKPLFSRLLTTRRCVVLVEGFYEWKDQGKAAGKVPFHILPASPPTTGPKKGDGANQSRDPPIMALAGLWDEWTTGEGRKEATCTVLTTDSPSWLRWLHDRCPVVLRTKADVDLWLGRGPGGEERRLTTEDLERISHPFTSDDVAFQWHPVTKEMSTVAFQGPECVKEVKQRTLASFFSKASPGGAAAGAGAGAGGPSSTLSSPVVSPTKPAVVRRVEPGVEAEALNADEEAKPGGKRKREEEEGEEAVVEVVEEGKPSGASQGAAKKPALASPSKGGSGSKGGKGNGSKAQDIKGVKPLTSFFAPRPAAEGK